MPNAKMADRARQVQARATVTTALMVDPGAVVPKGAAHFTFTAPSNAVEMFRGKAANIKALLQRYGDAVARSNEVGRPVSFRVDVGPDGGAKVTAIDAGAAPAESVPVEVIADRDPQLASALERARERGQLRAAKVLGGDDMLAADAFAEMLGVTRVTVNAKRQSGQLLGLEGAKRGFRFPVWQLDTEGKPYGELAALMERLGAPWAVYRFLVQRHGALDGMTGREALERGRGSDAIATAEGIARGDFT